MSSSPSTLRSDLRISAKPVAAALVLLSVALGHTLFQGRFHREIPGLMAMTLISMIPVLITFYISQRYFIQGIVISGIKG
jgi:ABC-type glycerol-3-phosphate transport system permease component